MAAPSKTKYTNTFRFKTFTESVNEIDIRRLALYRIDHQYEELDENSNETFFQQTLKKWLALNLTEEYNYFSKRCMEIVTLPQLLHRKDFVIDLLLERLAIATNLSLQPLLELLYMLGRDLREEFYPYFQRVLDRLISLLNTQDAEQLEWTLICLANLFKTLKPFLKRNIGVVFNAIIPLLDEERNAEHVTNFAVECFAYIVRDVRDFPRFLTFILEAVLREQIESVHGCGRLLFELLRGVSGQLHSVAGDLLQQVFDTLLDKTQKLTTEQSALLAEIIKHALQLLLGFLQVNQISIIWQKLCKYVTERGNLHFTEQLLHFMDLIVQHRQGRFVNEVELLAQTLLQLLDQYMASEQPGILNQLAQLIAQLLQASNAPDLQLNANRLLYKTLSIQQRDTYEDFVSQILDYQPFDIIVLPHVVAYFEQHLDLHAYELLARIVLHRQPLTVNAENLKQWQSLLMQIKRPATITNLEARFTQLAVNEEIDLLLLILAPHILGYNKSILAISLPKLIEQHLLSITDVAPTLKQLKILLLLLQTHFLMKFQLKAALGRQLMNTLLAHVAEPMALGCLQLLFYQLPRIHLLVETSTNLIAPLLSQPSAELRLMAAHCLQSLHRGSKEANPYGCIYAAACVEPNVHNYRVLLLQLQQLETAGENYKLYEQVKVYKSHTVSFLLGLLYYNFKFVWEPVLKLLDEYVKVMDLEDFWQLYKAKLLEIAAYITNMQETTALPIAVTAADFKSKLFKILLPLPTSIQFTKQQAMHYRILLWERLPQFGNVIEVKNADLVRCFLEFHEKEYRMQMECSEYTWNLLQIEQNHIDEELEDSVSAEKHNETITKQYIKNNKNVMWLQKTLQTKLGCFVFQPNPKALYRQSEMHNVYMNFLAGSNAQLQQLALDCLAAYKEPALLNYKNHLAGLIDEEKFRSTLANFKLSTVEPQHREDFMKYMLPTLYGKMLSSGSQRQLNAQQRKTLTLRFLGQLNNDEILQFLRMAFDRYDKYTQQNVGDLHTYVTSTFQPDAVISGKQLQRIVNLLELIRKEFAGRMQSEFQTYVLKLLLFVGSVSKKVLELPQLANSKLQVVYKNVKTMALQTLVKYFGQMNNHDWTAEDMNSICTVFVWTGIVRLPVDSIHMPTTLLKLLLLWGEQPKYLKYLKEKEPVTKQTIFYYMIELLVNEKAKAPVRRALLTVIEQILLLAQLEEHTETALIIIQPYILRIVLYLRSSLKQHGTKKTLDKCELNIMSMLTKHVLDEETNKQLLELLLPIFIARSQTTIDEVVMCQMITTLSNLIKCLSEPEVYVRSLAPLFEQIHQLVARKMLCTLLIDIAKIKHQQSQAIQMVVKPNDKHTDSLRETARIIMLLNAWDKRWVEQPDYDKRLEALRELESKIKNESLELELGVLSIYNCFYFLRHDKDLGLRVNVSEHLKLLLPFLVRKYADDKAIRVYLMNEVFIKLVHRIIRDNNDNVRNEGISLLGEMVRQCPNTHEVLRDLAPLADKHDDEVDFFENITHLQMQRHARALQRLCTTAANYKHLPATRTLTQFLLPLAMRYLYNEHHTDKHTLVDAAIEAVGRICLLLPWQQYLSVLRHAIQKLRYAHEHQKQCVRIVVRILDAFHFDLNINIVASVPETEQTEEANIQLNAANELDFDKSDGDAGNDNDPSSPPENEQIGKSQQLGANAAKHILSTITSVIIPTLNRAINEKTHYDSKHKLNRKRLSSEREEEETQRVPIALALVKLLQKLPKSLLDANLPGVFIKVCTFLRSPLKSVRMLTRDILKKIMQTLGGSYFALLMEHLQSLLTRGFQVHVLSVTVHGVLDSLRTQLQPAHIESCLHNLLEVTLNDIFGEINENKEIDKIIAHTPEAKPSSKSYLTLHIAARNIRENCLLDLLLPFKEQLARSHSRKVTLKIEECFAKIVTGLVDNVNISLENLLIFIYGTISESISDLFPGTQKRTLSEQEKEKMRLVRPDCYLIQPEPKRSSAIVKRVKSNTQTNAHILVEFGLEMLHIMLKRKKLFDLEYQPFLNPLLPLLLDALKSTHVRATTFALKCFASIWNEGYKLSALDEYLPTVAERLFEILKNFSTFGATRQIDNAQLMRSAFKAIVALLRNCGNYELSDAQIDHLVLYIEEQLHENENQPICYTVLKALVMRKVDTKHLHDLIKRIGDLSIVSQSNYVRDETRSILMTYIMEYPLHKRVDQIVKFMSAQLCYSLPAGRQSAIEFILMVINKFPQNILYKQSEFLYLSLGTRLINDEDPDCKRKVAEALEHLLNRLSKVERQPLLMLTLLFFRDRKKPSVRELGAALISRFVNVEKAGFAARLKDVFPVLVIALTGSKVNQPGRFVRAPTAENDELRLKSKRRNFKNANNDIDDDEELMLSENSIKQRLAHEQRERDHELIQTQYSLLNIFKHCGSTLLADAELSNYVDELAYASQRLLGHGHNWARCSAGKIIEQIIAHYDFAYVGLKLCQPQAQQLSEKNLAFIYMNPANDIKSLVLDLCAQVVPDETPEDMIDVIVKVFLYVATMLRNVPFSTREEQLTESESITKINLKWLMRNIRFLINKEVSKAPHSVSIRKALFTLLEGLITLLNTETIANLVPSFLKTLVREMSEEDQNIDAGLRQQALHINKLLRNRIGSVTYDKMRIEAQAKIMQQRAERRKNLLQEKIFDPQLAAKRKASKQTRKVEAKRLKTAVMRGKAPDTKQKLKKRKRKAEEDLI